MGREKLGLWIGILILTFCAQCAVQFYPRPVSEQEKVQANLAHSFDSFSAWLLRTFQASKASAPERQKPQLENYMFYTQSQFRDPKNFYPEPSAIPEIKSELLKEQKDYQIFLLSWPSQYQPVNPEFWKLYQQYQEDWTAYALYYKHKKETRAGIVLTHGWTGGKLTDPLVMSISGAQRLVKKGFDVLFVQQPYHGLRMPKGSYFSGEYFISGEVSRLNEAMCQAVTDMRSAIRWMKERYELVGMSGGSLGGVVTLATVINEPNLDFAIAWVPPSSWAELTVNSALVPYVVQAIYDAGIGLSLAREIFYPTSPANFPPAIPKEDILILAGMGDNFVPVTQPLLVWERWNKPPIYWFAGGHVINFEKSKTLKVEDEFLNKQLQKLNKNKN